MRSNSFIQKQIRAIGLSVCKHIPPLRKLRYAYWGTQKKRYDDLAAKTPIEEKSIIFEAFGGRKYVCSPKAIYEELCSDPFFDDWTFYWSFQEENFEAAKARPELSRSQVIMRGSEDYYRAFASSKYWVQNNRVPEYIHPKEEQVYVQCWHGTPLKRLGYDVPETTSGGALNSARELADRFNLDANKWTYLLSPSKFTSQHLCDAFRLPKEKRGAVVLEEGYPRNDAIVSALQSDDVDKIISKLKTSYGIPKNKKVLLFAPTWRDDQYTEGIGYTLNSLADFDTLQSALGDEWLVLLRTHYYIANKFDLSAWEGFVYNVSDVDDINDLYCVADAICTDYSSVFFDYANTNRPLYFYWPDREHYENDLHGFYIDAETLPGPKCETTAELVDALLAFDTWSDVYGRAYERFRSTYCALDDGKATQRVVAHIFKN